MNILDLLRRELNDRLASGRDRLWVALLLILPLLGVLAYLLRRFGPFEDPRPTG